MDDDNEGPPLLQTGRLIDLLIGRVGHVTDRSRLPLFGRERRHRSQVGRVWCHRFTFQRVDFKSISLFNNLCTLMRTISNTISGM